jgi:hypothetical protein
MTVAVQLMLFMGVIVSPQRGLLQHEEQQDAGDDSATHRFDVEPCRRFRQQVEEGYGEQDADRLASSVNDREAAANTESTPPANVASRM